MAKNFNNPKDITYNGGSYNPWSYGNNLQEIKNDEDAKGAWESDDPVAVFRDLRKEQPREYSEGVAQDGNGNIYNMYGDLIARGDKEEPESIDDKLNRLYAKGPEDFADKDDNTEETDSLKHKDTLKPAENLEEAIKQQYNDNVDEVVDKDNDDYSQMSPALSDEESREIVKIQATEGVAAAKKVFDYKVFTAYNGKFSSEGYRDIGNLKDAFAIKSNSVISLANAEADPDNYEARQETNQILDELVEPDSIVPINNPDHDETNTETAEREAQRERERQEREEQAERDQEALEETRREKGFFGRGKEFIQNHPKVKKAAIAAMAIVSAFGIFAARNKMNSAEHTRDSHPKTTEVAKSKKSKKAVADAGTQLHAQHKESAASKTAEKESVHENAFDDYNEDNLPDADYHQYGTKRADGSWDVSNKHSPHSFGNALDTSSQESVKNGIEDMITSCPEYTSSMLSNLADANTLNSLGFTDVDSFAAQMRTDKGLRLEVVNALNKVMRNSKIDLVKLNARQGGFENHGLRATADGDFYITSAPLSASHGTIDAVRFQNGNRKVYSATECMNEITAVHHMHTVKAPDGHTYRVVSNNKTKTVSEKTRTPSKTHTTNTPHTPDTPTTPTTPDKPKTPDTPTTPTTPDKPKTPDTPTTPTTPDKPKTPDTPTIPDKPKTPDTPTTPTTPDKPHTPDTPTTPDTPKEELEEKKTTAVNEQNQSRDHEVNTTEYNQETEHKTASENDNKTVEQTEAQNAKTHEENEKKANEQADYTEKTETKENKAAVEEEKQKAATTAEQVAKSSGQDIKVDHKDIHIDENNNLQNTSLENNEKSKQQYKQDVENAPKVEGNEATNTARV